MIYEAPEEEGDVEIEVQYLLDGKMRREPIERWMRHVRPGNDPGQGTDIEPLPWVFAGSYTTDNGVFAADPEGAVIAVVVFLTLRFRKL